MTSLTELVRERYLKTLQSVPARWKMLIVDEFTKKMLLRVLTLHEVLDQGVQEVELITDRRAPQRHLAALYLIMPTTQNVELILRDHSSTPPPSATPMRSKDRKNQSSQPVEPPKYASAHLHFVDGLDDKLAEKVIKGLPPEYLVAFRELHLNFHPLEARSFTLDTPKSFLPLYSPPSGSVREGVEQWEEALSWMSRSIVNSLIALGEYPLIRYYHPPITNQPPLGPGLVVGEPLCKRLANRVQRDIDLYARNNTDFPPTPEIPRPQGVLFITDRSMDVPAALLHEFTYQSMCYDLLDIENGSKYRYSFRNAAGGLEDKEVNLSENDTVWRELRHMRINDASQRVVADLTAFTNAHSARFAQREGGTSLNDLRDMAASLPQQQELKDKLSSHVNIAGKCMELFDKRKLERFALLEQCYATKVGADGKEPKTQNLVEDMVILLDDPSVRGLDKVRMIALYIIYEDGASEGDKKRLYQHARLSLHEMDAVDNLVHLGINVLKAKRSTPRPWFWLREESDATDISRFQPALKYMIEDHFTNRLPLATFPYVREPPVNSTTLQAAATPTASLRGMRAHWVEGAKAIVKEPPRQRALVFVAGGATYSEVRSVYKLSEQLKKDIFLGTTHMLTPEEFVNDLAKLDRGGSPMLSRRYEPPKKGDPPYHPPHSLPQSAIDRRYHSTVLPQAMSPPLVPLPAFTPPPPKLQKQQPTAAPATRQLAPAPQGMLPSTGENEIEKKKRKLFGFKK